ncbi:MAG: hypothetical protein HUU34_14395 [Saprospiraceae bacterium]|nr:hypothetical protein [Saprospiraceae bacterium]
MHNIFIGNDSYVFEPLCIAENTNIWITNIDDFHAFDWHNIEDSCRIYVLAELKLIDDQKYTDFYGFHLVKVLRLKKVYHPIIICSFAPKDYFLTFSTPIFHLLRIPFSHPYLQLPLDAQEENTIHPVQHLSKYQLEDIKFHFFDPQGLLDEYIHHLKNLVIERDSLKITQTLEHIDAIIPERYFTNFVALRAQFLDRFQQSKTFSYQSVVDFKNEIQKLLPARFHETEIINTYCPWRVLLIDDNPALLDNLENKFLAHSITCFKAINGEEAFDILERDFKGELFDPQTKKPLFANSIAVVISDLRFVDAENNWQPWQGYDIIEKIAHMPNFVSLFVLTSKKGVILDQVARMNHLRIHWYAKEDVLDEISPKPFSIFCSKIRTEGEQMFHALTSSPKSSAWQKPWDEKKRKHPLRDYYKYHQLLPDYAQQESNINKCAYDFIYYANLVKEKRIKTIENVGFSQEFQGNIPGDPGDETSMEHFYNKLIGRRIALGLYLNGWPTHDISDIMKYGELKHSRETDKTLFSTHLALSINLNNDIPHRLLVEERVWIENELRISLEPIDKFFFHEVVKLLEKWQDILRKKGSPHDYVENEITIGSQDQLYTIMTQAFGIAKEFEMQKQFVDDFNSLSKDEKLMVSLHKHGFLHFLSQLSSND